MLILGVTLGAMDDDTSSRELNRLAVLNRVLDRRLTQAQAAKQLGDYEALREMGGWSSWQAMAHYVAAVARLLATGLVRAR